VQVCCTLRRISEVQGRTEDILRLPDNQFLHPRSNCQIIKEETHVLHYQLIQQALHQVTLDFALTEDPRFPEVRTDVAEKRRAGWDLRRRSRSKTVRG